jgi:hypothetical protein
VRTAAVLLLCTAIASFAGIRTGVSDGHNPQASCRGTYTIEDIIIVGLAGGYGMAIQDDVADRAWVVSWDALYNYEYDLALGIPTANEFEITDAIDPDDEGYCSDYAGGSQYFFGHWQSSGMGVFDDSGIYMKFIDGPATWDRICGVDAGGGFLYASTFYPPDEIGWAAYTGTEASVTWTTAAFASISGMSVWDGYLFVCCQLVGEDNIFIFEINPDGSPNLTPVWSTEFTDEDMSGAGGVDYDGTYLWLYPQNTDLYKLSIDWTPGALDQSTWGEIKAAF